MQTDTFIQGFMRRLLPVAVAALVTAGCQSPQRSGSTASDANADSGPDRVPRGVLTQPDPIPRDEPLSASGNAASYVVYGQRYHRLHTARGFDEVGVASWYGKKFHGRLTASGEPYDMYGLSAAHRSLPLPTFARVTNLANNRSVTVRINDRGPFVDDRLIDLSYGAAAKLGMLEAGTARVRVVTLSGVPGEAAPQRSAPVPTLPRESIPTGSPPVTVAAADPLPYVVPQPIYDPQDDAAETATLPLAETTPVAAEPVVLAALDEALYLQLGAFGSFEAAGELRSRVDESLTAPVFVAKQSDSALFKVQAGPFASSQALDAARLVLREQHALDPIVFVQPLSAPACC